MITPDAAKPRQTPLVYVAQGEKLAPRWLMEYAPTQMALAVTRSLLLALFVHPA